MRALSRPELQIEIEVIAVVPRPAQAEHTPHAVRVPSAVRFVMGITLNETIRRLLDGPSFATLAGVVRTVVRVTPEKATGYAAAAT